MQEYKVEITANNSLCIRQIFNSRTKAQKYILEKYKAYSREAEGNIFAFFGPKYRAFG